MLSNVKRTGFPTAAAEVFVAVADDTVDVAEAATDDNPSAAAIADEPVALALEAAAACAIAMIDDDDDDELCSVLVASRLDGAGGSSADGLGDELLLKFPRSGTGSGKHGERLYHKPIF